MHTCVRTTMQFYSPRRIFDCFLSTLLCHNPVHGSLNGKIVSRETFNHKFFSPPSSFWITKFFVKKLIRAFKLRDNDRTFKQRIILCYNIGGIKTIEIFHSISRDYTNERVSIIFPPPKFLSLYCSLFRIEQSVPRPGFRDSEAFRFITPFIRFIVSNCLSSLLLSSLQTQIHFASSPFFLFS